MTVEIEEGGEVLYLAPGLPFRAFYFGDAAVFIMSDADVPRGVDWVARNTELASKILTELGCKRLVICSHWPPLADKS